MYKQRHLIGNGLLGLNIQGRIPKGRNSKMTFLISANQQK